MKRVSCWVDIAVIAHSSVTRRKYSIVLMFVHHHGRDQLGSFGGDQNDKIIVTIIALF